MATRRDNFLGAISDAGDSFRQSMASSSTANQAPPAAQRRTSNASIRPANGTAVDMAARLQRGLSGLGAAASSAATSLNNPGSSSVTATSREVALPPPPELNGDELPDYSRADPRLSKSIEATSMREHVYSKKAMEMTIRGCGKEAPHPLFVQDMGSRVAGKITLSLTEKPELVTAIRVKLKCVLTTRFESTGGTGPRAAPAEELVIWEEGQTVFQSSSLDGERLHGISEYEYAISIPTHIPDYSGSNGRAVLMPPSYSSGGISHVPVADVRYYLKATLARPGLFRSNDRILAPIVYIQRAPAIDISHFTNTLQSGTINPAEWEGVKQQVQVQKGIFKKSQGSYEAVALLPKPAKFDRYSTIPIALKVRASDTDATGKFPPDQIFVGLVQRLVFTIGGRAASFETGVAAGKFTTEGSDKGTTEEREDGLNWCKRFNGSITIKTPISPTFLCPNLYVSYCVFIRIANPGGELRLRLPVEIRPGEPKIIKAPSAGGESSTSAGPSSQQSRPISGTQQAYDLPPSYFDVAGNSSERPNEKS